MMDFYSHLNCNVIPTNCSRREGEKPAVCTIFILKGFTAGEFRAGNKVM